MSNRKRVTWQLVTSEDDGQLTGRIFAPKIREDGISVVRLYGYDLSFGIPTVQFNTGDDPRDQATVHLGTKVQSFDSGADPNVAVYRFSDVQVIATSGVMPKREQRVPWVSCDLLLPYLFVSQSIDSTTTSQDYITTGNMEYEWVKITDDAFAELLMFWEIDFQERDSLTPGLNTQAVRATGITAPYFQRMGTEEL